MEFKSHSEVEEWLLYHGFKRHMYTDYITYMRCTDELVFKVRYKNLHSIGNEYGWKVHGIERHSDIFRYIPDQIHTIITMIKLYFKDIRRDDIVDNLLSE